MWKVETNFSPEIEFTVYAIFNNSNAFTLILKVEPFVVSIYFNVVRYKEFNSIFEDDCSFEGLKNGHFT